MSWIIGFAGPQTPPPPPKIVSLHLSPKHCVHTPHFWLGLSGLEDTFRISLGHNSDGGHHGWAVVGLGLQIENTETRPLASSDWNRVLSNDKPDLDALDGHFVAVRWDHDRVECFSDQLGLRTLYFARADNGIYFSTRLDWLARCTGNNTIDFGAFGSRWLLSNQISSESCLKGVERLGPGGKVIFKSGSVSEFTCRPWLPDLDASLGADCMPILGALINPAGLAGHGISLGLSGGLDSRVLLALLLAAGSGPFSLHTFGVPEDPDVLISGEIASEFGLERRVFDDPLPPENDCIQQVREFSAMSILSEPVSSFLKLRYYPKLRQAGKVMMDGGFGEISRRQYLNRIATVGRRALRQSDFGALCELMSVPRSNIFKPEVCEEMRRGTLLRMESLLKEMPQIKEIGLENFLDLLAVRTRVPNFGGPEQSRLDGQILNYMPFAQPSYLRTIFRVPIALRKNGRFFRSIIRNQNPALTRFPLAKFGTTFPFPLPTVPAWVFCKVKGKLGHRFVDRSSDRILMHLRQFIQDTVHSHAVRSFNPYDHDAIIRMVESYYAGNKAQSKSLDWWLSFELWRQSLSWKKH